MELLAPVGNVQNFHVALDNGADAVYVGAPGFNARNLSRDLQIEEIAAMIEYCRKHDKKLYVAANSLILEKEFSAVLEHLALLDALRPDALIVQDFGLIRLIHRHFPKLRIHGSTLTTAHNSETVQVLGNFGCERVVLARELTLKEIETIARKSGDVELEVFIHGAMCFSYSGLCMFSSFLGGKSGLRGRCVQPCRRAYSVAGPAGFVPSTVNVKPGKRTPSRTAGKPGMAKKPSVVSGKGRLSKAEYLFSMNDLSGLSAVPVLRDLGIASLKIEGRLRSAHYVEHTVRAYRMMIDATAENVEQVLPEAEALAEQAMSRKTSTGYFFSPQPSEAISPQQSGNMGLHLGRFTRILGSGKNCVARIKLKDNVTVGDRLRLHIEPGGERIAFTLKEMRDEKGEAIPRGLVDENVQLLLPSELAQHKISHCDIYKVDGSSAFVAVEKLAIDVTRKEVESLRERLVQKLFHLHDETIMGVGPTPDLQMQVDVVPFEQSSAKQRYKNRTRGARAGRDGNDLSLHKKLKLPLEWWLRLDSSKAILNPLPFTPDRYVLSFDKAMIRESAPIKRYLGKNTRKVIWALPPLVMENDLGRCRKNIQLLIAQGFRSFQVGHISQIEMFGREKVHLYGDYSLNLMNAQSLMMASEIGFEGVQISMEGDRESIFQSLSAYKALAHREGGEVFRIPVGLTIYGTPPLYTARLASSHLQFDRQLVSPKDETFVIRKREGYTQTHPVKPFSLLPYLDDIKELGVNYVVMDLSGSGRSTRELDELAVRLAGTGRVMKLPTFNYLGELQ